MTNRQIVSASGKKCFVDFLMVASVEDAEFDEGRGEGRGEARGEGRGEAASQGTDRGHGRGSQVLERALSTASDGPL